jgi:predicted O-linked N-acetylglucosamine transferase (SPINDLY family)
MLMTLQQQLETGLQHHKAGRFDEAAATYRQVLAQQPNHPDALHLLGLYENHQGRRQQAVDLIHRALSTQPNNPNYLHNLGLIYVQLNRYDEAITVQRRAIELSPKHPQLRFDLGNAYMAISNHQAAIAEYRNCLSLNPNIAEGHQNLGCALHRVGQLDLAESHLRRAIELQPAMADAHNNLGSVLSAKMRFPEAIASYNEALRLRPDSAVTLSNLGSALRTRGQTEDAIKVLNRAVQLNPNLPEAYNNLGIALKETGRLTEAIAVYKRALSLRPNMGDAINNLGNAYKDSGNLPDAIACYGRSLVTGFVEPGVHSNMIYTLQFHPGYDDESLYREQRRFNEIYARPLADGIRPHINDRSPERKLRIGYVSAYFYSQAESFFVAPLLENHDKENFEIHCYASVVRGDQFTKRLRDASSVWHDVLGMKDGPLAERIQNDGIDILMDLAMHMAHNRMLLFARKPAPVQVTWLAYPGGTGLDAMDYRITDAHMDPFDKPTDYYREESIRLPDCWACYNPLADIPQVAPRGDRPVTFGSINNPCKNNEQLLSLWARIIAGVPGSRLLIQAYADSDRQRIGDIFQRFGVGADRIEYIPRKPRLEYLRIYDKIDLCLDPLPYNGITTTCDALWMGVPVVTLSGRTAAGRAGVGILSTVGLPQLIAHTEDEFARIVTELANDPARLADYRATLRERMTKSQMMDGKSFAQKMEVAYRQMWHKWCASPVK